MKRVEMSRKQENLADGEGRHRPFVLVLQPMPKRVTATDGAAMADGQNAQEERIGAYLDVAPPRPARSTCATLPTSFRRAEAFKIAIDTRPGTVADLFEGYVAALKGRGQDVLKETKRALTRSPTRSAQSMQIESSNRPARDGWYRARLPTQPRNQKPTRLRQPRSVRRICKDAKTR